MPANLKELRGKIRNVKSTQQITKAMKLVSAAKFGRAQHAVTQSRPYFHNMSDVVGRLGHQSVVASNHLVRGNDSSGCLLFVVSSQRGLCGGYNANIAKEALAQVKSLVDAGKKPTIMCLGRKAYQLLGTRLAAVGLSDVARKQLDADGFKKLASDSPEDASSYFEGIEGSLCLVNVPFERPSIELGREIGEVFRSLFLTGSVSEVRVVFSKFGSAISQTPTAVSVLPMQVGSGASVGGDDVLFEPSASDVVSVVLPRFLDIQVLQVLKEALASEHGARMTAMDNATRNAKDMERKYQIRYQRARQAAITTELVEIISGAEAL